MTTIIEERLKALDSISPVLGAFLRSWNDALDDEKRQALKPHIPRVIGTAGDGHDEERAWMAADWLVRVCTPAWLDLAGLKDSAGALRSLPPITRATVSKAHPTVKEARAKAIAAVRAAAQARNAAGDAAWAEVRARTAARAAVRAAAWAAAVDAAWAAATGAAAWAATGAAACDAAEAAATKAKLDSEPGFEPVKVELQRSAHELLDRMIDGPFGEENA